MRTTSLSTTAVMVAAAMIVTRSSCCTDAAPTSNNGASRRSFGGNLPFVQRKQASSSSLSALDVTLPALEQQRIPCSSSIQNASHNNNKEPSDREARYAMQYGEEVRTIRATEHAYLMHDDEFAVIPAAASNRRIIRKDGPLNGRVMDA